MWYELRATLDIRFLLSWEADLGIKGTQIVSANCGWVFHGQTRTIHELSFAIHAAACVLPHAIIPYNIDYTAVGNGHECQLWIGFATKAIDFGCFLITFLGKFPLFATWLLIHSRGTVSSNVAHTYVVGLKDDGNLVVSCLTKQVYGRVAISIPSMLGDECLTDSNGFEVDMMICLDFGVEFSIKLVIAVDTFQELFL